MRCGVVVGQDGETGHGGTTGRGSMAKATNRRRLKVVTRNRRASHEYELSDRLECGVVLVGTEVKSLRDGHCILDDAYAKVDDGELWLIGCEIPEYAMGNRLNHKPKRDRKLLLHRREMAKFAGKASRARFHPGADRRLFQERAGESRDRGRSRQAAPRQAAGAQDGRGEAGHGPGRGGGDKTEAAHVRLAALVESAGSRLHALSAASVRAAPGRRRSHHRISPAAERLVGPTDRGGHLRDADAVILQRKLLSRPEVALLRRVHGDSGSTSTTPSGCATLMPRGDLKVASDWAASIHGSGSRGGGRRERVPGRTRDSGRRPAAWVIPTCVDVHEYPVARHERRGAELVWVGSSSTLRGLEAVTPLLERMGRRIPGLRFKLVCDRFIRLSIPVIECPGRRQPKPPKSRPRTSALAGCPTTRGVGASAG